MITTEGNVIDPRGYRASKYACAFTEYLSDVAMRDMERGSGDVECPTGYFVRLGRRIVFTDSRGFVWHETYGDAFGASQVFDALEHYYGVWCWDEWREDDYTDDDHEQALADADAYLSYVICCESESLVAFDYEAWVAFGRSASPFA